MEGECVTAVNSLSYMRIPKKNRNIATNLFFKSSMKKKQSKVNTRQFKTDLITYSNFVENSVSNLANNSTDMNCVTYVLNFILKCQNLP